MGCAGATPAHLAPPALPPFWEGGRICTPGLPFTAAPRVFPFLSPHECIRLLRALHPPVLPRAEAPLKALAAELRGPSASSDPTGCCRTLQCRPGAHPSSRLSRSVQLQRPLRGVFLRPGAVPAHRARGTLPQLPRQHGRAPLRELQAELLPLGAAGSLPALPLPPRRCVRRCPAGLRLQNYWSLLGGMVLVDSLLLRVSPSSPSCVSPRLGLSLRAGRGPHRLPAAAV